MITSNPLINSCPDDNKNREKENRSDSPYSPKAPKVALSPKIEEFDEDDSLDEEIERCFLEKYRPGRFLIIMFRKQQQP